MYLLLLLYFLFVHFLCFLFSCLFVGFCYLTWACRSEFFSLHTVLSDECVHVLKRSYRSLTGVTPPTLLLTAPATVCGTVCGCLSSSLHLFVVCLTLFSHQTVRHFIVLFIPHLITRTATVPLWSLL